MATLTPSEKHWQVAPTRCLPSPSILTRFATESTAGCQAPRNRQLSIRSVPLGSKSEVATGCFDVRFAPNNRHHAPASPKSAPTRDIGIHQHGRLSFFRANTTGGLVLFRHV